MTIRHPLHHDENCPMAPIVDLFGGRWKTEILWSLEDGPQRFNELRRLIPRISQKMLTQQLRQLERDGLVRREHFPEIPPRVEYSMTELGKSLRPIFERLGTWGSRHLESVLDARAAYDEIHATQATRAAV